MRVGWVPYVVVGALLLTIPLALKSVTVAIAVAVLAVLLLVLAILGLDRTSVLTMVAAFALASWDKYTLPVVSVLGPSDALFIVAIGLALPRLMTRRLWLPPAFLLGASVYVTFSILASLNSEFPGESYYYAARIILTVIGIPALLVWWGPRGKVLVALVVAYAVGTGISIAVGLPNMGGYRNYGLSQHPNILGYTAVLALALLPFLMRAVAKPHRTWICLMVFGIAGVGIMTSGSRAALLVAIILLVLYPAAERSILAALAVLASGVVGILIISQRNIRGDEQDAFSRLLGSANAAGSDHARIEGVATVWAEALAHPFLGTGFTLSGFLGHNAYVQIAAAAGFISLAAFLLVCFSMVMPLFAHDDMHSRLVYPAIVFIIAAPVSPNLTDRYIGFLMGLSLVGVVAVYEARRERQADEVARPPRKQGHADATFGAPAVHGRDPHSVSWSR